MTLRRCAYFSHQVNSVYISAAAGCASFPRLHGAVSLTGARGTVERIRVYGRVARLGLLAVNALLASVLGCCVAGCCGGVDSSCCWRFDAATDRDRDGAHFPAGAAMLQRCRRAQLLGLALPTASGTAAAAAALKHTVCLLLSLLRRSLTAAQLRRPQPLACMRASRYDRLPCKYASYCVWHLLPTAVCGCQCISCANKRGVADGAADATCRPHLHTRTCGNRG